MNSKNKFFEISIILFFIFANYGIAGEVLNIPSGYIEYFSDEYKLSESRFAKFEEILRVYNSQSVLDRNMFKSNPVALVEAGLRRLKIFDSGMESFLSDKQKEQFIESKRIRISEKELYILREGLFITDLVAIRIGFILEEYNSRIKIILEKTKGRMAINDREETSVDMKGGSGGRGGRSGGKGGGRGGMNGGGRNKNNSREELKSLNTAKSKRVIEMLTETQKEQYKLLKKYLDEIIPKRKVGNRN